MMGALFIDGKIANPQKRQIATDDEYTLHGGVQTACRDFLDL